ncbi:FAD-binding protein [Hazenella sp. IB182357]|uniref:FAD-binding protein n=1 Tax=Polycladospora coralii TaxID=2771432 RepID=A0A926RTX5_9BACL|nr:D-arabinono-1,4-lactone oxidase [Polycladospora coralii]MBD1371882.1 FAD-binding protein [Polycladospora coralii]MBS7529343.1 FAD-binding protein [Polycladospora coralii]
MSQAEIKKWENWSGSVKCQPQAVLYPQTIAEVVALVKKAKQEQRLIRVVGSGHSFTRLVETDDQLVSLDRLQGIVEMDEERKTALVWGGTKLKALGELLAERGYSQENLGDINAQSIAGAISTGTHGTGIQFGSISTQAVEITMVNGEGEMVCCSAEQNPDLFKAAQVSLGTLGIIVQVRLRVLPKYRLHLNSFRLPLSECIQQLEHYKQENRHFEFYWFPYTDLVQMKLTNITEAEPTRNETVKFFKEVVVENGAFWCLSEATRFVPKLAPAVSRISANGIPATNEIEESHRMFATSRLVRFQEMEYSIPADCLPAAMAEIKASIDQHQFAVHFPIECRFVAADDIWLSSAYGRDSAYIAVHMYRGMEYEAYFKQLESILQKYEGRPHWGKMHHMEHDSIKHSYPKLEQFNQFREQMDPQGLFLNDYVRKMLVSS